MCVALAVFLAADFVVVGVQDDPARRAGKTFGVEFQTLVRLEVLALNATVARVAERPVELVVVLFAVGRVFEDVELGGGEGVAAGPADEAMLVVTPGQTARGVLHGLSDNRLRASSAVALTRRRSTARSWLLRVHASGRALFSILHGIPRSVWLPWPPLEPYSKLDSGIHGRFRGAGISWGQYARDRLVGDRLKAVHRLPTAMHLQRRGS